MPLPGYQEFMRPVLEALSDGGEHNVREAYAAAADPPEVVKCGEALSTLCAEKPKIQPRDFRFRAGREPAPFIRFHHFTAGGPDGPAGGKCPSSKPHRVPYLSFPDDSDLRF